MQKHKKNDKTNSAADVCNACRYELQQRYEAWLAEATSRNMPLYFNCPDCLKQIAPMHKNVEITCPYCECIFNRPVQSKNTDDGVFGHSGEFGKQDRNKTMNHLMIDLEKPWALIQTRPSLL